LEAAPPSAPFGTDELDGRSSACTKVAFVSTAIPYVNARPHVGFAFELIQADVIARYLRRQGYDTCFVTGTDENSLKNVRAARELGLSTEELCEGNSALFRDLIPGLDISADDFIRTSRDPRHAPAARRLWSSVAASDIYVRDYEGLYCVGCEDFPAAAELVEPVCPEHGTALEAVRERNYFFRLSAYQSKILEFLESGAVRIVPESRRREMIAFVRRGLRDFSISRTGERAGGWGIRVPDDPDQVMYVWFDALANYISALGYAEESARFRRFWLEADERIHVIGKGINRFHTIYWPAILLSAGLPLPHTVLVHGYLTVEGRKISKSLGNVIDPLDQVAKYGVDPFRYYLLRFISPFEDGDYAEARLQAAYHSDLANNLGNLLLRLEATGEQAGYVPGASPSPDSSNPPGALSAPETPEAPASFHDAMGGYRLNDALALLWTEFTSLNQAFEVHRPWELARQGRIEETREFLANVTARMRAAAFWLEPFLPGTARRILDRLQVGQPLRRGGAMFPREGIRPAPPA
jgi:methionyl-tRNA synthetase